MSIRVRLALWYGTLFALVLLLVGVLSYAFHGRGHYDELDRALVTTTSHTQSEAVAMGGEPHLSADGGGLEVAVRLYDREGRLEESSTTGTAIPSINPRTVLAGPGTPAYDRLIGLVPSLAGPPPVAADGAFGLITTSEQRWRVYVVPLKQGGVTVGYIEALAPLGRLDDSMVRLRSLLLGLGLFGVLIALVGSWILAGRALEPVSEMVQTAQVISHGRDLTQRVTLPRQRDELGHLAETLNEMLQSLEEASRAQQRFVADASHELRAPLTAIQGNLELLERQPDMPTAERQEALGEARREAARLARLVADLLALARADAGVGLRRRPVDLDGVVLEAINGARQLVRGQHLVVEAFEPAQVMGDEDRLKQLILILLDNALKYTPAGRQVVLELRRNSHSAEVSVRDTGVGIPAEALPHVFERFYRADPARARDPGGTGLGLPIAQWIVEQHAGQIQLASEPGQGTTVTVSLPIST